MTEEDLVKAFRDQFETEILKTEDLADENPVFVPTDVATIVVTLHSNPGITLVCFQSFSGI